MALTHKQQLFAAMRQRIDSGVTWLNTRTPSFWDKFAQEYGYNRQDILNGAWLSGIDIDELDLYEGHACVLGQVGKSYSSVVTFAGLSEGEASSFGFNLDEYEYDMNSGIFIENGFGPDCWSLLTELWIVKIKALRKAQKITVAV